MTDYTSRSLMHETSFERQGKDIKQDFEGKLSLGNFCKVQGAGESQLEIFNFRAKP